MPTLEQARALVRDAAAELADDPSRVAALVAGERRLTEPLRVALAGTLKSGKSTLLNALVGEEIAPTDATECTRVVTWFAGAPGPRIEVTELDGRRTELPVCRAGGRLSLGLGGVPADRVARLTVGWPSAPLDRYTLIDTPGTASNNREVSARTLAFLTPDGGGAGSAAPTCPADAIIYLMRARADSDLELLRRIQRHPGAGGGPLGVLGVLSRADETGAAPGTTGTTEGTTAGTSGMATARRAAHGLRTDPELAGLLGDVVAVSGLLAVRGQTLRQREFTMLRALAGLPDQTLRGALLSPGRFAHLAPTVLADATAEEHARLSDEFGMLGIRTAVALIRRGARDAPALAAALVAHSGLDELRATLDARFGGRHEQLKAHSVVRETRAILAATPSRRAGRLLRAADRLLADSPALTELRVLAGLAELALPEPTRAALERTLGGRGAAAPTRLALPPDAPPRLLRAAAARARQHWRTRLDDPLLDEPTARAYRAAARGCEAILAGTDHTEVGRAAGPTQPLATRTGANRTTWSASATTSESPVASTVV